MKVVECEKCGKKMGKKPEYTVEERGGHYCNDCWREIKLGSETTNLEQLMEREEKESL